MNLPTIQFDGLELLSSAILVLDAEGHVVYANPAAEYLLETSSRSLCHHRLPQIFVNGHELEAVYQQAVAQQFSDKRLDVTLERNAREPLHVHMIVTALDRPDIPALIEFRENVQQL